MFLILNFFVTDLSNWKSGISGKGKPKPYQKIGGQKVQPSFFYYESFGDGGFRGH